MGKKWAKRKNQRKLYKLPGTNSVFISKKNIYVFYIYLFIALGIFQKHKFVNFWKDFYAWLGSDTRAPSTEAILCQAKTV